MIETHPLLAPHRHRMHTEPGTWVQLASYEGGQSRTFCNARADDLASSLNDPHFEFRVREIGDESRLYGRWLAIPRHGSRQAGGEPSAEDDRVGEWIANLVAERPRLTPEQVQQLRDLLPPIASDRPARTGAKPA